MRFLLNSRPVEVDDTLSVEISLNEYLRVHARPRLTGSKISCNEGGCGSCTVTVTDEDGRTQSVNSCLFPLPLAANKIITTVEGLSLAPEASKEGAASASRRAPLHPIQQRLVQFHGTQCGFCTPGIVMQMYASLLAVEGGSAIGEADVERRDYLAGNLCRCTGYRSINDTLKSFAKDSSVRDLIAHAPVGPVQVSPPQQFQQQQQETPPSASTSPFSPISSSTSQASAPELVSAPRWIQPTSLQSLQQEFEHLVQQQQQGIDGDFLVIAGHTGHGIYGDSMRAFCSGLLKKRRVLSITNVPELTAVEWNKGKKDDILHVGAGVSLARLIDALNEIAASTSSSTASHNPSEVAQAAADHLSLIAGHQVRNVGTIGGNIMMARNRGFASDAAPLLLALEATVDYIIVGEEEEQSTAGAAAAAAGKKKKTQSTSAQKEAARIVHGASLDDFLRVGDISLRDEEQGAKPVPSPSNVLLISIHIPLLQHSKLITQRTALRPRNAYAIANAALTVKCNDSVDPAKLSDCRLYFGALGGGRAGGLAPIRAVGAENILRGRRAADLELILNDAISSVRDQLSTLECGADRTAVISSHQLKLVQAFLFKSVVSIANNHLPTEERSAASSIHAKGNRTTQSQYTLPFPTPATEGLRPAFESHPKSNAASQVTGDTRFVADASLPKEILYAAYVQIPAANATFSSLDDSVARDALGSNYGGLVQASDLIGTQCSNTFTMWSLIPLNAPTPPTPDPCEEVVFLPANTPSGYAGQPVALALATTQRIAEQAAASIILVGFKKQEIQGGGRGESASKDSSLTSGVEVSPVLFPPPIPTPSSTSFVPAPLEFNRGDRSKVESTIAQMAQQDRVIRAPFTKTSQSHFYMEPQSCIAELDEEGGMMIQSAAQQASAVQEIVTQVTNIPRNRLHVEFRRCGGGFGGKGFRNIPIACAAAVATIVRRCPIHLVLPRRVDTAVIGGRPEVEGDFEVAVDPNGRIRALRANLRIGAGSTLDFSVPTAIMFGSTLDNVYGIELAHITIDVKRTCTPPRTAMRGPGHVESITFIETVLDTIADVLGIRPDLVREVNFLKPGLLSRVNLAGALPEGHARGWSLPAVWDRLKQTCDIEARIAVVETFNAQNRWKKRGISITPSRSGIFRLPGMNARVDIFKDAEIQITVAGAEIGQGLHTKAGQVACAIFRTQLGVEPPLESIRYNTFDTRDFPQGSGAGGSSTSEMACFAVEEACMKLSDRLKPAQARANKACKGGAVASWAEIISTAFTSPSADMPFWAFDSSATGFYLPSIDDLAYDTFGAACSEVEVDILTGETRVLRSDIVYDTGPALNPAIDLGQIEGAFVMGLGQMLLEHVNFDITGDTGANHSLSTWDYKIPSISDFPADFRVHLLDAEKQRTSGLWDLILGSTSSILARIGMPWKPSTGRPEFRSAKAVGEPPLYLSYSIASAIRSAIRASRQETGTAYDPSIPVSVPLHPAAVASLTWARADNLFEMRTGKH